MNIKIIGSNCSNGIKLRKMVTKARDSFKGRVVIELLDDDKYVKSHNVKNVPGLIINDKLVSEGKVLNDREIIRLMNCFVE